MTGPGDATIEGTVDNVSAHLSGSGNLKGRDLVAAHSEISVSGPGSAAVRSNGKDMQQAAPGRQGAIMLVKRGGTRSVEE